MIFYWSDRFLASGDWCSSIRFMSKMKFGVGIDGSPFSLRALDHVLGMARPGDEIFLIHVVDSRFVWND
jgi:hypothetical protein